MEATNYRLLERVAERYDGTGRPVTPEALAGGVETDVTAVSERLVTLENCALLASEDGGYRPTVTARELLALDIDDPNLLVVDADGNC